MIIWIYNKEISYTYDQPTNKDLITGMYNYDLIKHVANKYDGLTWNSFPLTNSLTKDNQPLSQLIDGSLLINFYPNDQVFEYFNAKENKWLIIPRL